MNGNGFGRIAMLAAHEPPRFVGADWHESDIRGAQPLADVAEKGGVKASIADEVQGVLSKAQEKTAPEPPATCAAEPIAPVLRGREGDIAVGADDVFFPPIEFDDFFESSALHQPGVRERNDRNGLVALRNALQRGDIAVVVVIMANEYGVDFWQSVEGDSGGVNPARSEQVEWAHFFAVNRVDQQRALCGAQKKGGVVDPRNRQCA